jgi:hypothetical protein
VVFAESEIIGMIAKNTDPADIAYAALFPLQSELLLN